MKSSLNEKSFKSESHLNHIINTKMIIYVLGILLWVEAGMFLICNAVALMYSEPSHIYFTYSMGINLVIGGLFILYGKNADKQVTRRDGYCIVSLTWILFTMFGMLPFWLSGCIPNITDAVFETMSGFTTTGATVLDNIESLPKGMLFWRSLTQWIGGLGIVCFTIAILPIFGIGNLQLFSAEATGVTHDKIHPKISIMTKWIWTIYTILTVVETILLVFGGMSFFDSVCHAFCTTATGGYSTKQSSVAYWNSPYIEYVISIFMILSSVNFSLYFLCIKGKFKRFFQDSEFKWFIGSVLIVTIIISISLFIEKGYGAEAAFRKALFQVASIHTSCGFATDDYNTWPTYTWMLLIFTMLAGGCTGSTSGGIKNMRIMILFHSIINELKRLIHPNAVIPVKVNNHVIPQSTISTVAAFTIFYLTCAFIAWTILMFLGIELTESFGVVISSIGNVGPGLGAYGPAFSWSALPDIAKWILTFLMMIGRLELLCVLVLFTPTFWKEW